MNLYEFFSTPDRGTGDNKKIDTQDLTAKENAERLEDALFWSILDDDYLHKHYFLPLARSIKKQLKTKQADYTDFLKQWYPMVVAGCNAYYKMHALTGDKDEIFDKPLKIRVCKRIAQQFHDDITKDYYKLGESTTEAVKQRIDPTCWKGKHKEGTKIKSGVKVNNCVPNESVDSDMQFDMIEEMVEQIAEEYGVDAEVIWEDFEAVDDITLLETAAWQKKSGKNKTGGLNRKGVMSYRKEHPVSKLQTAVTTPPSKLKPGSKAAKRRKSFCARMGGSKGPMKDKHGKPTRKALALRKWNCRESVNVVEDSSKLDYILVADGKQIYKFRDSGEAEAGLRFMQRKLPQKNFELKHEVCTLQDIGEQQGMAKSSDESRSVRSAKLHFETVDIKIDDVYAYLNERSKVYSDQITSDTYFPGRFINGVRHFVNETAEHVEIKPFIDKLQKLDYDKTIKVGDMFAVLQFDINFASKEIEAFGFVKPKEISDIKIAKNGKIQYITFVDGDKFPRQTPATYEGRPIGIAAYFDSNNAASKALTMLSLSVPDGWELYLSNLSNTTTSAQQQGVAEGFSNDMSTEDMIAYLRQHHDKNLHQDYLNHITSTNIKFVLKNIPINSIRTELSGLDRAKVEQYKQMDFSKAPPIVVGRDGNILDGYHRATAAKELNIPTIKAYVGVKGQQGVAEGYSNTTFNVDRRKLNVPALIQKGAILVTHPHGEQGWETDNKEDWAFSLLSLYNVLQGGWPSEAKKYLKPQSYKRAEQQINSSAPNLGSDKLVYDGKYNQILWSIKKLGIPDNVAFLDKDKQGVAENFADRRNTHQGQDMNEDKDWVSFEVDSEDAYDAVMQKFGHHIEWQGDYMIAPRHIWSEIEQTAGDAGGNAEEISDENMTEETNPEDTVTVDIPLLIRIMEYAREDAKTDMDLHDVTERLIELSKNGDVLSMKDYESIVNAKSDSADAAASKPVTESIDKEISRLTFLVGHRR